MGMWVQSIHPTIAGIPLALLNCCFISCLLSLDSKSGRLTQRPLGSLVTFLCTSVSLLLVP